MSRTLFFDTSALIKLYHQEPGTERVEKIFGQMEDSIIISALALVEVYSSLSRKLRTGEISLQAQEEAIRNFEEDCAQRFVVEPLGIPVVKKAQELLRRHGNTRALQSLDALQLAAGLMAHARGELVFVCVDSKLLEVAVAEGLQIFNPETPQ